MPYLLLNLCHARIRANVVWEVSSIKKAVILLIALLLIAANTASAHGTGISDVGADHWAFAPIKKVVDAGIIPQYENGRFDPDGKVTRAEFARIMVKALGIETHNSEYATFLDVWEHWARPYVEAAKFYLTGFKTSSGFTFKPDLASVREDMAVALVKAKGMQDYEYSSTTLDSFADKLAISASLAKYVCIAVEQGIMVGGTGTDGRTYFRPQSDLTRAETASLITRVADLTEEEEKVSFDEEKVTIPVGSYVEAATLEVKASDNSVVLKWNAVTKPGFKYYKLVMSKHDSTPAYPQNGYIVAISNPGDTSYTVKPGNKYNGGDFGGYVKAGETYYFSVTAVYNDQTVPGNVIEYKVPGTPSGSTATQGKNAVLEAQVVDGGILLNWTNVSPDHFSYYKVVLSTRDSSPKYPDDGYIVCTNETSYLVKSNVSYSGGDFGGKTKSGQTYYISVTSVYDDAKNTSNVLRLTLP